MDNIFSWEGLNFINTIAQVVITVSAVVAIIITISQLRYRGKANISGYYKCGLGTVQHNDTNELEIVAGINIKGVSLKMGW